MKANTNAPKWATKANATIKTLKAKKEKTAFDWVRLTNAKAKIEDKSLSKLYKRLEELTPEEKTGILGKSKFPTFKEFTAKAQPGKQFFSLYSGLMMLKKFNKQEKTQTRVKRQNKAQLKKVG